MFLCQANAQRQIPISNGDFETTNESDFNDWSNKSISGGANFSIETGNLIDGSTKALKAEIITLGDKSWLLVQ